MTSSTRPPHLGHVAISADAPHRVAAFYRDLLGLQIIREAGNPLTGAAVLLSGDPGGEDHELAVFTKPAAEHIAFRVYTREQLRKLYTHAKRQGLEIPYAIDSSVALGFFLRDPGRNAVEVYVARSKPGQERPPLTDPEEIDHLILA